MANHKKKLDLVIAFLQQERTRLIEEIQLEQGQSKEKIALKNQLRDAIANLEWCQTHEINADQVEVVEIPEGGSDAHFTEFYLVDERGMEAVPDWAIKKNERGEIKAGCFDLILSRK